MQRRGGPAHHDESLAPLRFPEMLLWNSNRSAIPDNVHHHGDGGVKVLIWPVATEALDRSKEKCFRSAHIYTSPTSTGLIHHICQTHHSCNALNQHTTYAASKMAPSAVSDNEADGAGTNGLVLGVPSNRPIRIAGCSGGKHTKRNTSNSLASPFPKRYS